MIREPQIPLFDLIMCLSGATDLVSISVANHHKQVAYIAFSMGQELGLPIEEQNDLLLAGSLHDIGALSLKERLNLLQFDVENPHRHAELGYLLLKGFEPFLSVATLVRFHHVHWNEGAGFEFKGERVSIGSHILHLSDRIDVLINKQEEVLSQIGKISERVKEQSGKMFIPSLVDAYISLSAREYFWLDMVQPSIDRILFRRVQLPTIIIDMDGLLDLTKLFSHVIDFRSRFTATHSSGVSASAEALARLTGLSKRECVMMRIAGYLHDLGKLAIPTEILEKPAKLTENEFNIIKTHPFHTFRILETIKDLDDITAWGSLHHERLDGKGYPFHYKGDDLPIGSQIMAVADIFTALTEDRPYRKGLPGDRVLQILQGMANGSALNSDVVSLLANNYDEINSIRISAQEEAFKWYQEFESQLEIPTFRETSYQPSGSGYIAPQYKKIASQ
jgi:HD-GYP domain-containing protein (c-di-GMP phosphodiesterase class II)